MGLTKEINEAFILREKIQKISKIKEIGDFALRKDEIYEITKELFENYYAILINIKYKKFKNNDELLCFIDKSRISCIGDRHSLGQMSYFVLATFLDNINIRCFCLGILFILSGGQGWDRTGLLELYSSAFKGYDELAKTLDIYGVLNQCDAYGHLMNGIKKDSLFY